MNHEEDHLEDAALTKAAWSGHIDVIRILFDAVADMNSKDCCCKTALIRAAEPGHADVVRALVDAGAELNLKTSRDETALIKVAKSRHIDVVRVLVDVGADDRRAYYAGGFGKKEEVALIGVGGGGGGYVTAQNTCSMPFKDGQLRDKIAGMRSMQLQQLAARHCCGRLCSLFLMIATVNVHVEQRITVIPFPQQLFGSQSHQ